MMLRPGNSKQGMGTNQIWNQLVKVLQPVVLCCCRYLLCFVVLLQVHVVQCCVAAGTNLLKCYNLLCCVLLLQVPVVQFCVAASTNLLKCYNMLCCVLLLQVPVVQCCVDAGTNLLKCYILLLLNELLYGNLVNPVTCIFDGTSYKEC